MGLIVRASGRAAPPMFGSANAKPAQKMNAAIGLRRGSPIAWANSCVATLNIPNGKAVLQRRGVVPKLEPTQPSSTHLHHK